MNYEIEVVPKFLSDTANKTQFEDFLKNLITEILSCHGEKFYETSENFIVETLFDVREISRYAR